MIRQPVTILSDDADQKPHYALSVMQGMDGDYYVAVMPKGDKIGPVVRLSTSGGASTRHPGVTTIIHRLYDCLAGESMRKIPAKGDYEAMMVVRHLLDEANAFWPGPPMQLTEAGKIVRAALDAAVVKDRQRQERERDDALRAVAQQLAAENKPWTPRILATVAMYGVIMAKGNINKMSACVDHAVNTAADTPAADRAEWLVWSNDAKGWWCAKRSGYTIDVTEAGRYTLDEAMKCCRTRSQVEGENPTELVQPSPELIETIRQGAHA